MTPRDLTWGGEALSVLRELPTLSFREGHNIHRSPSEDRCALGERGLGGERGRWEDLRTEPRRQAERTSSIQRHMSTHPKMKMNMRARRTCESQSQDRNNGR